MSRLEINCETCGLIKRKTKAQISCSIVQTDQLLCFSQHA